MLTLHGTCNARMAHKHWHTSKLNKGVGWGAVQCSGMLVFLTSHVRIKSSIIIGFKLLCVTEPETARVRMYNIIYSVWANHTHNPKPSRDGERLQPFDHWLSRLQPWTSVFQGWFREPKKQTKRKQGRGQ